MKKMSTSWRGRGLGEIGVLLSAYLTLRAMGNIA